MLRHLARGLLVLPIAACGLSVVGSDTAPATDAGIDATPGPTATTTSTSTSPDAGPVDAAPSDAGADVTTVDSGTCKMACAATQVCEATKCVEVAKPLDGFRYELKCMAGGSDHDCPEPNNVPTKTVTLMGTSGKSYDVSIHVRGIVEQRTYPGAVSANATAAPTATGPTNQAFFVTATVTNNDSYNTYPLTISNPATVYCLNSGTSGHPYVDPIDYNATIRVAAGASVSMQSQSTDTFIIRNVDQNKNPIVVPGVPPAPNTFDGQFFEIEVNSVAPVP